MLVGFDGKPFIGKVTSFSRRRDPETRNIRTEIDLPNPKEQLYPGTYAEVSPGDEPASRCTYLPAGAVGSDGNGNFVYTNTDNLALKTGLAITVA